MAISDSDPESSQDYNEIFKEKDCCNNSESDPDYHLGTDSSYSNDKDTSTKFHNLSIKKKSSFAKDSDFSNVKDPELGMDFSHIDDKSYENVQNIIKDGRLEKLKVDECKVYLRRNGLRLSGNKDVLIQRIKEHLEISNGGGEKKYPLSSFVVNCKGDACTGDVVMFEQNVYEMFNIASRSASGPPCGTRIVVGRIVKESYGSAKQQHTFTIEVLWSKGEKPLPPLHPLLIKGRSLYRLKTLRQRWKDEGERQTVLVEKHSRGSLARSDREVRIQEKERRKMLRSNRESQEKRNISGEAFCSKRSFCRNIDRILAIRETRIMTGEPVNVNEFRELARQALPKMYYDFYTGGAEDQYTLKENEEAFRRIIIQPRILRNVRSIDLSTTVLGYNISMPVMIAPTSLQKLANPEGEIATARAASACNTIMVLSTSSTYSLEEVAACCGAIRFFQLYVYKRRDISAKLVQRAENNGYKAIVLTVDSPRLGRREADVKNKLVVPPLKNLEGLLPTKFVSDEKGSGLAALASGTLDASFCWQDIKWLKSITNLPILIKGVLTREDAIKALEVGVDGMIVSNHGGRQLDYSPATISVLEEVVDAVGGKAPVLVDGGIRRGTDIFKAMALGAQAVLVGRAVVYGLAAKGEKGVNRVLEMLKEELELTMALSGCCSVKEISRSHVRTKHDQQLRSML